MQMFSPWFVQALPVAFSPFASALVLIAAISTFVISCIAFHANVFSVVCTRIAGGFDAVLASAHVLNAASSAFVISRIARDANVCFVVCTISAGGFDAILASALVLCAFGDSS